MFYSRKNEINELNYLFKNTGKSVCYTAKEEWEKQNLLSRLTKAIRYYILSALKVH